MNIAETIERLGALILERVFALGGFLLFLLDALMYVFLPPYKPRLIIRQVRQIGADSMFLIILIAAFTGMVLGLQGYNTLRLFGSEGALGTVVALALVRELGPVLAALMITARAGSAMAAELGSMQVHRADRRADRDGDQPGAVFGVAADRRGHDHFSAADRRFSTWSESSAATWSASA